MSFQQLDATTVLSNFLCCHPANENNKPNEINKNIIGLQV